ncbi:MAG: Maf family protein [Candidatus Cloacimonetes bacterium]|nr:Maf family protein [Candidatus Cloacimonadota bacterium]
MIHQILNNIEIVLASASPRRRELFALLGLQPIVLPSDVPEPISDEAPELQAMKHAKNKATKILPKTEPNQLIVAADTLVVIEQRILGKPENVEEARSFLRMLSNRKHSVYTGVCLIYKGTTLCDYEKTEVCFAPLSDSEISAYLSTKEPMDKAGAYGIQGYGAQFIVCVNGCYFNVMGFPIRKFYDMLSQLLQRQL